MSVHYQNEMCSVHIWHQLWNECNDITPNMPQVHLQSHIPCDNL